MSNVSIYNITNPYVTSNILDKLSKFIDDFAHSIKSFIRREIGMTEKKTMNAGFSVNYNFNL